MDIAAAPCARCRRTGAHWSTTHIERRRLALVLGGMLLGALAGALLLAHARLWMPLLPVLLTGGVAVTARRHLEDRMDPTRTTLSAAPHPLTRSDVQPAIPGRCPMGGDPVPAPVRPLAAFSVPNYRRFVIGQTVSLVGSWTETVAQALLVLGLTGSRVWLGLATAARYLPVLLLTPYAGLIVDRHDKRKVLLLTQASLAAVSLVLGAVVVLGAIQLWMVFVVAIAFGVLTALDNPVRMALIPEIVGPGLIRNAITLNSTFVNVGRAVGPVVAAALVAGVGVGWCFVANGLSFAGVLAALLTLDASQLRPGARVGHHAHQLRDGLAYARGVPDILAPLCMMALIGTFTYEFEVTLPLFARGPLAGGATTYSWLMGAFGLGAVLGGIYCTRRAQTGVPRMIRAAAVYMVAMVATACTGSTAAAVALLVLVGFASIIFLTTGNSTIQIAAAPAYRGRVTALWSTAFIGSTPIGATIVGAIGAASPRLALLVGAAACGVAVLTGAVVLAHSRSKTGLRPDPAGA